MKHRWKVFLACGIFIVTAVAAAKNSLETTESAEKSTLEQLRTQIQKLKNALFFVKDEKNSLQQQLRKAEIEIGKSSGTLKKLKQQLHQQKGKLATLQQSKNQQTNEIATQQHFLGQQIRASYAMGQQGYFKMLLNQQDPATIGRMSTYYDYLNKARQTRITDIATSLEKINILEQDITLQTQKLEKFYSSQQQQNSLLEEKRKQRHLVLAKLKSDIQTKEQRLKEMIKDEIRLTELVARLREKAMLLPKDANVTPFAIHKGNLMMPIEGKLVTRFGTSRKLGKLKWQGVTIRAEEGAPVNVIYHGRVVFSDWLRGFGLLMIVDHGKGYMSLYGHNQALYKEVGEWVQQGQQIASIGNSGGQTEPGLYFEIRHKGLPVNPIKWCKLNTQH